MSDDELPVLQVTNLTVEHRELFGDREISLRGVTISLDRGEVLAVAGESGCGKSVLTRAVSGGLGPDYRVVSGSVRLAGEELLRFSKGRMREVRRKRITFVDSDPRNHLNPTVTVRRHLREAILQAGKAEEFGDEREWSALFSEVGIVDPEEILETRGAQLNPLLIQRIMLLTAIVSGAELIVCDNPTEQLDGVAENQFFEVLNEVKRERRVGVLLTLGHLSCVEKIAERVCVLYRGGVLECGSVERILSGPDFAYTREFWEASPHLEKRRKRLTVISSDAAREAEEAIHRTASSLDAARRSRVYLRTEERRSGGADSGKDDGHTSPIPGMAGDEDEA